jgi:hypothetical protein
MFEKTKATGKTPSFRMLLCPKIPFVKYGELRRVIFVLCHSCAPLEQINECKRGIYAAARKVAEDPNEPQAATKYDELRLRAIAAQRTALQRLRERGEIGEEAFHRIQEELDWSELDAAPAGTFQPLAS